MTAILGGERRKAGDIKELLRNTKVGAVIPVLDSIEADRICAGARHYKAKFRKRGDTLTRIQ